MPTPFLLALLALLPTSLRPPYSYALRPPYRTTALRSSAQTAQFEQPQRGVLGRSSDADIAQTVLQPQPAAIAQTVLQPQLALDHAQIVVRELGALRDDQLSKEDFERVIRAHADAGLVEGCLAWLRRMRRARKPPPLACYALVVAALTAAGRRREAARWLRRVVQPEVTQLLLQRSSASAGDRPSLAQFNQAMIAYGAAGQPKEAMEVMRRMVGERGKGGGGSKAEGAKRAVVGGSTAIRGSGAGRAGRGGVSPNVISFNSLIAAHANGGAPERAHAWIDRMRGWGIEPDSCSFTTAIAGFAKAGQPDRARSVMEEMQAETQRSPSVRPDVRAYSALVEAYARVGRLDEAQQWLEDARAAGVSPNVSTNESIAPFNI